MTRFSYAIVITAVMMSVSAAQIELGGSANVELSAGGSRSNFLSNEIPAAFSKPHVSVQQLNLFLFSDIDDAFRFTGRIQFDTWGSGELNAPRLTLAQMEWSIDSSLTLLAGRIISPFGSFSAQPPATGSPFISAPLLYGYFVNLSENRGLWREAGTTGVYRQSDVGVTTLYFGGYVTGIGAQWSIVPQWASLDAAISNTSLSSPSGQSALNNMTVSGRLLLRPAIFWQQGISLSYGGIMQRDPAVSPTVDRTDELSRSSQLLFGTDWKIGYSYVEVSGEFVRSQWNVPRFDAGAFALDATGKLKMFEAENFSWYVDAKYEPPFFSGSVIALRYEQMVFSAYDDGAGVRKDWDDDVERISAALGYKLARNVLWKFSVAIQSAGGKQESGWNAVRTMIAVTL